VNADPESDVGKDERPARLPRELWDRVRANPARAPEQIALAAADIHGPTAARWVASRRRFGAPAPRQLAVEAKRRHARLARIDGAALGLGGFVTVVPDIIALAWIQSRMIFFIAAGMGYDPTDPMRPAELLVLQGTHDDPLEARATLDGMGSTLAEAYANSRLSRDSELAMRLSALVAREGALRLAGRSIPGFASIVNAVANERTTRALGNRAIVFYGG
jgi:hypothetical protein